MFNEILYWLAVTTYDTEENEDNLENDSAVLEKMFYQHGRTKSSSDEQF
jgi:hypothetical protein